MGTTKAMIVGWFDAGVEENKRWMIIACDTFDYEDYPIYIEDDVDKFYESFDGHNGQNMQRIMEVYDLHEEKAMQLCEHRCRNEPKRP